MQPYWGNQFLSKCPQCNTWSFVSEWKSWKDKNNLRINIVNLGINALGINV